jgi:hypothetical protein
VPKPDRFDRGQTGLRALAGGPSLSQVMARLDEAITKGLAAGRLAADDVPDVRLYAEWLAMMSEILRAGMDPEAERAAIDAAYTDRYSCRAAVPRELARRWARGPAGNRRPGRVGVRLTCQLASGHGGDHYRDGVRWRPGETPDLEQAWRRRGELDDLVALCSELAVAWEALGTAMLPGGAGRAGRRSVPGSRPPAGEAPLDARLELQRTVVHVHRQLRIRLGHRQHPMDIPRRLRAIPMLVDVEDNPDQRAAVVGELGLARDRARRQLRWDADVLWLGPCPTDGLEPIDVLTRGGIAAADTGCWSLDHRAMADYTAGRLDPGVAELVTARADAGEPTAIWARSRLGLARDSGDIGQADVTCPSCGYRSRPQDRAAEVLAALESAGRAEPVPEPETLSQ